MNDNSDRIKQIRGVRKISALTAIAHDIGCAEGRNAKEVPWDLLEEINKKLFELVERKLKFRKIIRIALLILLTTITFAVGVYLSGWQIERGFTAVYAFIAWLITCSYHVMVSGNES